MVKSSQIEKVPERLRNFERGTQLLRSEVFQGWRYKAASLPSQSPGDITCRNRLRDIFIARLPGPRFNREVDFGLACPGLFKMLGFEFP